MSPKAHARMVATNRWAETFAFIVGVLNLSFHAASDTVRHLGWCLGDCTTAPDGVPWPVILISAVLIAPKMLGRANATGIIRAGVEAITLRLRGVGASSATVTTQAPGQPERPVAQVETPASGGEATVTVPVDPDHTDGVEEGTVPVTGLPLDAPVDAPGGKAFEP